MPTPTSSRLSFLEETILGVLKKHGFDKLSAAEQQQLLPQFVAQAQVRLGTALSPMLSKKALTALEALANKTPAATPVEWQNFWQTAVPTFNDVVQTTLSEYFQELQQLLKKVF